MVMVIGSHSASSLSALSLTSRKPSLSFTRQRRYLGDFCFRQQRRQRQQRQQQRRQYHDYDYSIVGLFSSNVNDNDDGDGNDDYANTKSPTVLQMLEAAEKTKTTIDLEQNFAEDSSSATTNDDGEDNVWGSFALLLFSQFLLFTGVGAVIPSIPLYGKELGLTGSANGIVISAPAVALLLCANAGGQFADKQGRKKGMIYGMILIAVSDVGTALSQNLLTLTMARLGLGAGRAISESGERGMLADLANRLPDSVRGKALAAQQAVVALGIAVGAPLGGVVVEQYGPRAAFLCVSTAAIVTCALYCFLPETLVTSTATSKQFEDGEQDGLKAEKGGIDDNDDDDDTNNFALWRELLQDDQWKGLSLVQAGASFGYAAKIAAIPILAAGLYSNGAAGSGALLSVAALSGLVGAPLGGVITDEVGAKQTAVLGGIVSGTALAFIPLSLSLSPSSSSFSSSESFLPHLDVPTVSIGNLVLDETSLFFSIAVIMWSMATAAQGPALTALAQKKATVGYEASSLALVKAAGDMTYIFAPLLMGFLADTVDGVPGIQCLLAGSAGLMGTLALASLTEDEAIDTTNKTS
eukprot:CAMPEP_0113509768 /NCGR_PEP_ID=MMETSP0014_2-20120614/37757_1 /TAXON_ID=2857 /ORGANISM="Nitzschia sp." /LENGTH=581 /DNA_ID=CAMNT_0000405631 /DNA_START=116 /DNA_END=1861 /DNA_ORIENTATION=- /assembly_acc=CAM_ASM_000159